MRYQTKAYKALFLLLQAGLWERKPKDISIFPLTQAEWNSVFVLAQQQTVLGITYRGLDYLPEYLFPSQELLIRWVAEIDRIEQRNLESNQSLIELVKLFSSHGLKPILQKGQGVATFYDRPLLRTCGDIDLWFPTREERLEAVRLIKEQGIAVHTAADRSNHYMWHSIEVEHHRYLLDLQSPFAKGWGRRMVLKMQPTTLTLVEHTDTAILTPSPEINLLLLNAHICKHAIGLGIGLRQICDIARAYLMLHDRVDGEEIRALYHRAGLKRWSRLLHSFLVEWIGLDRELLPYEEPMSDDSKPLLEVVLRGGNFGQHTSDREAVMGSLWERKLHTARSFIKNCRFSFRYAPMEAVWTVWQLTKGQLG